MPTVTSENLADFNETKMGGKPPESYSDEKDNGEYNKVAAKANQYTDSADDVFDHREAYKQHRVAAGLAQLPENRAYHRAKSLEHEDLADKMERMERRQGKKSAEQTQVTKARGIYEKATRQTV